MGMMTYAKDTGPLIAFLQEYVTPERLEKFHQVLSQRTRHLTVVLEDIYQSQNASAVLRSCECFGIQDVHIIENSNLFDINPEVVMGASKWLSLHRYNQQEFNTISCLKSLRDKGYRLIATSPDPGGVSLDALPLEQKTALLFGTELEGLSPQALEMADGHMHIPMMGFTESFNISVSVAICLHHLTRKLHNGSINWQLPAGDYQQLLLEWIKKSIKSADALERFFLENQSEGQNSRS
jgi:tRNA (guanosine-2'-O-)-methyltransferase